MSAVSPQSRNAREWATKEKLWGGLILAVIIAWIIFGARGESRWAQRTVDDMFRRGWSLASADRTQVLSFTRPWRIFIAPVSGLAFVRPDEIVRLPNGLIFASVAVVRNNGYNGIKGEIHNCREKKFAFFPEGANPRSVSPSNLEWLSVDGKLYEILQIYISRAHFEGLVPHPNRVIQEALDGWPMLQKEQGVE